VGTLLAFPKSSFGPDRHYIWSTLTGQGKTDVSCSPDSIHSVALKPPRHAEAELRVVLGAFTSCSPMGWPSPTPRQAAGGYPGLAGPRPKVVGDSPERSNIKYPVQRFDLSVPTPAAWRINIITRSHTFLSSLPSQKIEEIQYLGILDTRRGHSPPCKIDKIITSEISY